MSSSPNINYWNLFEEPVALLTFQPIQSSVLDAKVLTISKRTFYLNSFRTYGMARGRADKAYTYDGVNASDS